jgi:3-oxoacyl-[acyl-carrier protein] reductase
MELGLAGRRVVVTGGTRGIGRATVLACARAGAQVVTCHRHPGPAAEGLERELAEIGGGPHRVIRADVTRESDVARLAEECGGDVDVLVNNAGVDGHAPIGELTLTEWRRVLDADLTAAFLVTKALLPRMRDGGAIINVSASVALRGRPEAAHYAAAKAALIGLSRSLAKELGSRGIRVNTLAPGVVPSDGELPPALEERIRAMTALGRLGAPEDIADAVLFLAGDPSRYVSGVLLNVDGGV